MAYLRLKQPSGGMNLVLINGPLTTLGQDESDVNLGDVTLPKIAAHITHNGDEFAVSVAARKVSMAANGRKRKKHVLRPGDVIRIGDAEFEFHDGEPPKRQMDTLSLSGPRSPLGAYEKLHGFSVALMETKTVSELLGAIMDSVVQLTGGDKGFLIMVEGDAYRVKVARNFRGENLAGAIEQLSDSIVRQVVDSREAILVSNALEDAEYANAESVMKLELSSAMCAPLLHRGKLLGAIYVGSNRPLALFDSSAFDVLKIFAAQASLLLANALAMQELREDNKALSSRLEQIKFGSLVGTSVSMQKVFTQVDKVAPTDVSVLITGETGTGKELVARELHRRSERARGPFVAINCGAIPKDLLESELFGHVKGAFTGATANRSGKFQDANGGTLFLDEIGEMSLELQVKILRALQERTIRRVGAQQTESVDIRVLAATHRDLAQEIENGRFREDLYYRLNVIQIELPALRRRDDDVVVLARYFLRKYAEQHASAVSQFTPTAVAAIKRHNWPGNIRELENRIQKGILLTEGVAIDAKDLGLSESTLAPLATLSEAKEQFQLDYIQQVVDLCEGNRTQAAKLLGVDPRTIFRYLKKAHVREETT